MMILFFVGFKHVCEIFFFFYHNCFRILVRQFSRLFSRHWHPLIFPFLFGGDLPGLLMNEFCLEPGHVHIVVWDSAPNSACFSWRLILTRVTGWDRWSAWLLWAGRSLVSLLILAGRAPHDCDRCAPPLSTLEAERGSQEPDWGFG